MEDSLKIVGEYGNFQNHIKLIIFSSAFLTDIYSLQIGLMLKLPNIDIIEMDNIEYNNKLNNLTSLNILLSNLTNIEEKYCDKNRYILEINNNTPLKNWNYNFGFFCEKEWNIFAIIISVILGTIFGLIFFSPFPDRIGREKVFKYSIIISCFLHLNFSFCLNTFHLILINFCGGLNSFIYALSFVCITEYLPQESNGINIGIFNAMGPIYVFVLYIFLNLFNNWRIMFFCISIFHIFLTCYTWKYFLESPRWLFSIGQKVKCISVLDKISLYNGNLNKWNKYQKINIENANRFGRASTNFTKLFNFELETGENDQDKQGITIYDIFNFKSQTKTIIILGIICFMSNFNLSGIIIISFKKKNNFINSLMQFYFLKIIIGIITGFFCDKIGRKPFIMYGGLLGSVGLFIYTESDSELILMLSFFCFQAVNIVLLIYIPENIPTPIRGSLCGWLYLIYKICPLILEYFYDYFNKQIFNYCIIVSGLIEGLCVVFMNETLGNNIPDIIPELKDKIEKLESFNLKSFNSTEYPSFLE